MSGSRAKDGTKADLPRIRVRQIRSGIGFDRRQKETLRALGLGGRWKVRELPDRPEVRAMIASIPHLVRIETPREES